MLLSTGALQRQHTEVRVQLKLVGDVHADVFRAPGKEHRDVWTVIRRGVLDIRYARGLVRLLGLVNRI